jgi:4-amino-4-deoxy-L-arabinose transferase-like glycosyltransferase
MNVTWGRVTLALALFAVTVLVLVLLRPLLPVDETRYLTVAWEMWQGGSKLVPHLNGDLYTHKPPMLFWLVNLVWSVTGVSDLAARLVAPAFGLASVGLTAMLARRLWPESPDRAGLAALILASSAVFLIYGSATMFDTMLTTATLAAMLALVTMHRAPGLMATLGLGAALALGVYAKGPVILVHVLPVALLYPLWADRATRIGLWPWYRGIGLAILVALALVGLWLGPALVLGGAEYRTDVLWRQSAGRMVDSFDHDRPVWFFLALLPIFAWPWGWSRAALSALAPRPLIADEASRLVLVWAVGALIAFSLISGKQTHYLMPEVPALALLLSGMVVGPMTWGRKAVLLGPVLLVAGVAIASYLGLIPDAVVNDATMPVWQLALALLVVAGLVGSVLRLGSPVAVTALAAPLTVVALHLALQNLMHAGYDPEPIATELAKAEALGIATTDKAYAGQFTFAGRLQGPVTILSTDADRATWMAAHPGGLIVSRGDLSQQGLTLVLGRDFQGRPYRLYRIEKGQP